jgi:hypothetical protein
MNKRLRIALVAVVALAAALAGLVFTRNLIDFPVYYSAGRSLLEGRTDLYAPDFARGPVMDYRYPPFFLLLFYTLWLLPYKLAAYIWYLFSIIQIAACVVAVKRLVTKQRSGRIVLGVSILAVSQYFVMILHYGNAHLLAVSLLFAAYYFLAKDRQATAALLMALAITVKITPVLLLPYFAIKRRWKYLFLTTLFLVALNLTPAAYFGLEKNSELIATWYRHVIADQEFHETNGPINLSLKGQLRRYFSEVAYSERVDGDVRYPAVNLFSLPKEKVDRIWVAIATLFFLAVLALLWWRTKATGRGRIEGGPNQVSGDRLDPLEFGLLICAMLFVGPLTSKIYFISLLWPVVFLASFAFNSGSKEGRRARRVLTLVAILNSVLPLLPGRSTQRLLLVLGLDFYVNLLLMASLLQVLIATRRTSPELSFGRQTPAPQSSRTP